MRLSRPSSAGRRRALTAAAGVLLGLGIAAPAGPALAAVSADPTASVTYPVNGTTVIKAVNSTLNLGPGKLAATVDLTTGALTANLTLPPATGTFTEFGFIPVTATTELVPNGPTTGKVNFAASSVQSTSSVFLKLDSLKVAGIRLPIGPSCKTRSATTISLTSGAGFSLLGGGTLAGTYTIPRFSHCGLATFLINLTIPGPGNTISLTLGPAS